jgi:rhodanese-related sulfurtransferase
MKSVKIFLLALPLAIGVLFLGCSGKKAETKEATPVVSSEETTEKVAEVPINAEAQTLLDYLAETGDYVNSRNFPSLIKASVVYEELGKNNLILDIRDKSLFSKGHIKGADNVPFSEIPAYMSQKIKPFEYNRIILVCNNGQVSSYATSLLRLMGYGNVFAMRWGMSGWNKQFASENWLAGISGKYTGQLETADKQKAPVADFPQMNTGKTAGEEILASRIETLFKAGPDVALVTADQVFASLGNFYVINFERKDKYDSGHIPGAIRYKPAGTLGIKGEMETIPTGKEVVVYCGTGHNSAFATAYLRLFGYDAKTLAYGNNGFMHDKMIQDKLALSWLPFSEAEVEDYPVVKN